MQKQEGTQLDINLLITEYDAAVAALTSENVRLKAMLKQLARAEQVRREEAERHPAPPAPPAKEAEPVEENDQQLG